MGLGGGHDADPPLPEGKECVKNSSQGYQRFSFQDTEPVSLSTTKSCMPREVC